MTSTDSASTISMPKNARLLVRTLSGDVKLRDVADVEAHSVSGDVDAINIASHAVLETVSGDLTVTKVGGRPAREHGERRPEGEANHGRSQRPERER